VAEYRQTKATMFAKNRARPIFMNAWKKIVKVEMQNGKTSKLPNVSFHNFLQLSLHPLYCRCFSNLFYWTHMHA